MQVEEGVGGNSYTAAPFLTSSLGGVGGFFTPGKSRGAHCTGG
jgi:hypothetical protein